MGDAPNRRAVIIAGDSHSLAYNEQTYFHPRVETEFEVVSCNISGQAAAAVITAEDGKSFHPELIETLAKCLTKARDISEQPPLFVLSLGGPDTVLETAHPMWAEYDFILPAMPQIANRAKRCIQYELVKNSLDRRLSAFGRALDLFGAVGVRISAILPPPPAYRNDRTFKALLLSMNRTDVFVAPFPVRGKMAWMTRCWLSEFAARRGIPFVDTWPTLSDGLFLRPEYEFDGIHVTNAAAGKLLPSVCAPLGSHPAIAALRSAAGLKPLLTS